ncbi:hypothetical protein K505DRAFT_362689 [Melanomma pulvis-pyrius CBS 109.77]|uniref:F-box domain-containing protein n=1 Tax=Melanomma pulvis-pyrius CBS 109.77 TaxID=1314802 RepID=A0A6A6X8I7_9PLEO|nr:hypothetical protein K505DRAFT_362689 [Melanomma pulvis-pyrius CBS 109.77]
MSDVQSYTLDMKQGAGDGNMDSLERGPPGTFPFLKLPAELRNRVYFYASEQFCSGEIYSISLSPTSGFIPKIQTMKGLAFTQVCQQVRHEYRPIYMQKVVVNFNWRDWHKFNSDFYPKTEDPRNGPAEFQVTFGDLSRAFGRPIHPFRRFRVHLHSKAMKFVIDRYQDPGFAHPVVDSRIVEWEECVNAILASRPKSWIQKLDRKIISIRKKAASL